MGSKPVAAASTTRYVVFVLALMAIVSGLAWVMQYLPGRGPKGIGANPNKADKKLLVFERPIVRWHKKMETKQPGGIGVDLGPPKDGEKPKAVDQPKDLARAADDTGKEEILPKDVEFGDEGHYDFLFKNVADLDVEIVYFTSTCGCTKVKAATVSAAEWSAFDKAQKDNPAEPLKYSKEPAWTEMAQNERISGKPVTQPPLVVKAQESGVVRIEWHANKGAGQPLPVGPLVHFRAAGDTTTKDQALQVPIQIQHPILFHPQRIGVGSLGEGKSATTQFIVWSSTRKSLDKFKLAVPDQDAALFTVTTYAFLGKELAAQQEEMFNKKIAPNVLCAYRVTVTVLESKDGKRIEQGTFYRRWPFMLDGKTTGDPPLFGPEVVGRVTGDITVGGSDDQGKIKFKSFKKETGASHEVELATEGAVALQTVDRHPGQPTWIDVKLTRKAKDALRTTWLLEVTVPPNARDARSFVEPDAVVLRIVGTQRVVRIPIEGHISQ
ncbi:MAG: hypothetical protein HY289_00865 [Planctomycetes bacterium]|nr:hypothetical protein [Planctomycetota bacterium]